MLRLSMRDFPLLLWMKLSGVDRFHPQSNKCATVVENKATGETLLESQNISNFAALMTSLKA